LCREARVDLSLFSPQNPTQERLTVMRC
jgi:hypothetical protein